ncbi:SDR family NAD(P)-dependent oxidoreductase [Streptomyces bambusae]|uniref:NAD-dependent epimerase/dehydratase family protein n=1 Tax=Streptomyces bambusae TaxID=1550616 RepID=UPI001CFD848E|nr:NAD-dependent epimerase/dehydratase family protein [Streptomyces bambusae]MCB5165678.1 SDR family NAD(P)-dependent oxidoreductase [Streptomyces bambusae]
MTPIDAHLSAALSGCTVVVTGGGGLVGSRITSRLRAAGARVIAVGRLDAYPATVYADLFGVHATHRDTIVGDIADATLMDHVVREADYVIHAAAVADVAACTRNPMAAIQTNVTGTQVLLDAVRRCNARVRRFVFVSSAAVYGNGDPKRRDVQTWHEDQPLAPLSVYANTKAWGEAQTALVLGRANVSHTSVRYFSVYGEPQTVKEGSHSWVVAWMAMRAKLGLPLHVNGGGRQVRDFVHVDDIAEATVRAMLAPGADRQILNIGTGQATSIAEVAKLIGSHYPDAEFQDRPLPEGDPLGGTADTTRMAAALEWEPRIHVAAGLARYVAWLDNTPTALPDFLRREAAAAA